MIAASVRTLVVSWNDAAERNESVASAAFVIPNKAILPTAGSPPFLIFLYWLLQNQNIYHCSR